MDYINRERIRFDKIATIVIYGILVLAAIIMFFPIYWMFTSSFKVAREVMGIPPTFVPHNPVVAPYVEVARESPIFRFLLNSLKVASLITVAQLLTCSWVAYVFARIRFPGRDALFFMFLATLMVPPHVTIIPIYILLRYFNLLNTHQALIIPALSSAFGIFLLRQFFMTIPQDLEDAARLDGCGIFRIYSHVIIPVSIPALVVLAIFCFNYFWNEYFRALIFLNETFKLTLPIGIAALQENYAVRSPALILAAASIAVLPVMIIFLFFQKFFVEGITITGLKG